MTKEEMVSLEEAFVERHFELGDEYSTLQENLRKAEEIFKDSYVKVKKLADKIADGEIVDPYEANFMVQTLCFASKYKKRFLAQINEA